MKIPKDKQMHFMTGAILFNLSIPIALFFNIEPIIFGTILVFIAAAGKELIDYIDNRMQIKKGLLPRHSVEFLDFVASMLGAVPSILLLLFLL